MRLAIEALRGWDDHRLNDIGLERMDIELAVRGLLRPRSNGGSAADTRPHPIQSRAPQSVRPIGERATRTNRDDTPISPIGRQP